MSRGQKPRTPVHFPTMKVRGHRNRAKSKARFTSRSFARVRVVHARAGEVQFELDPAGTHTLVLTVVRDGWGRRVR